MAAGSVLVIAWRFSGEAPVFSPFLLPRPGAEAVYALALCAAVAFALNLALRALLARSESIRQTAHDIHDWLGPRGWPELALIAIASGIGEEFLFRGWLANETGIWISSILFGIVHVPLNRNWVFWPVFAAILGLGFAWLCVWTQTLLFAVILHAAINFLNLRTAIRFVERTRDKPDSLPIPGA